MLKLLSALLLSSVAFAANEPYLTTVAYDGNEFLYVGAKSPSRGAVVAIVNGTDLSHTLVNLPESISRRDILGIIPENKKFFVLTQVATDPNDDPLVSVYNMEKKEWKDIRSVECPIFTQVHFGGNSMIFHCERLTKRGKSKVKKKSVSLGSEHIHRKGSMRFPEFLLRYKRLNISLEGIALAWSKLHLRRDAKDQFLTATELLGPEPSGAK